MAYQSNEIKTTKSKGVILFTGITLLLSALAIVAFALLNENPILKGFFIIILSVFAICAFIVLYDQLFDYVKVKDDLLISKQFFRKKAIKIASIKKIVLEKGSYDIYTKNKKFCTISKYDKSTSAMLNQFEKHGFNLSKIEKKDYSN